MTENLPLVNSSIGPQNVAQAGQKENLYEFIRRMQSKLKNVDSNFFQCLMGGVKTNLRAKADRRVLAFY